MSTRLGAASPSPVDPPGPLPRWRGFNLQYFYRPRRVQQPNEDHFRWIADWGFDFVRLPMHYHVWLKDRFQRGEIPTPEQALQVDERALEMIDRAVEFGERQGVHVCLCFHTAPGYRIGIPRAKDWEPYRLWRDKEAVEAFTFHWQMFAKRYRNIAKDRISFNLFNEAPWPNDNFNGVVYRDTIAPAVAAIRQHSPERIIIADGAGAANLPVPELVPLGVNQSVHCYLPGMLSHYKVDWMQERSEWPVPRWPGALDENDYVWDRAAIERYHEGWQSLQKQGIGIHMGETGCSHRLPHDVALAWLGDVLGHCRDLGIGWALWDFIGESKFGILDSDRADVDYVDWYGHKLDKKMLALLQNA